MLKGLADTVNLPITELNNKLRLKQTKDVNIILNEKYENSTSTEIRELYKAFNKLSSTLKFESNTFVGNDTQSLLEYAEACEIFQEVGNIKAMGICHNNMGNIHYRNKRYREAVEAYTGAVKLAIQLYQYLTHTHTYIYIYI